MIHLLKGRGDESGSAVQQGCHLRVQDQERCCCHRGYQQQAEEHGCSHLATEQQDQTDDEDDSGNRNQVVSPSDLDQRTLEGDGHDEQRNNHRRDCCRQFVDTEEGKTRQTHQDCDELHELSHFSSFLGSLPDGRKSPRAEHVHEQAADGGKEEHEEHAPLHPIRRRYEHECHHDQ